MLHDPKVLILDEPTSGLDPNQLVEVRSLIKRIGADKTVILSTHIMQEVTAICNRVIIINKGKLVADDSIAGLQSRQKGITVVLAEFKEPANKTALLAIPGVTKVDAEGKVLRIEYTGNADMRELLFRFAVEQQLTLLNLQIEKQSLEDVFQSLTK
jgi:ABC-2 type transport system ATP-binding protein